MLRLASGDTIGLRDVKKFVEGLLEDPVAAAGGRRLFDDSDDVYVARAPGRLDVMGGIADYSGSLVLQWPTREATLAAVQRDASRRVCIVSLKSGDPGKPGQSRGAGDARSEVFEMRVDDFLEDDGRPISYGVARRFFEDRGDGSWAAYAAGAFLVLMRERGAWFDQGARILVQSDVPEGKGVSSSAALEVAVMTAVAAAFKIRLPEHEIARLCQIVENRVVGAPCGIMDQIASACGESDRLLALVCQPSQIVDVIPMPDELAVWGIDSGTRHAVGGSTYGNVRIGTFMGYRIIAEREGLRVTRGKDGTVRVDDPKWNGYLSNILPPDFESTYLDHVPDSITGAAFLGRYGGLTDSVVRVDPGEVYNVRTPTGHPIYENLRVHLFAAELRSPNALGSGQTLGTLMRQSHHSYSACGLGSDATDHLLRLVDTAQPSGQLFGARVTGGGSGGTVAVIGCADARKAIDDVVNRFAAESGHEPHVFVGSSPGAGEFGVVRLSPED